MTQRAERVVTVCGCSHRHRRRPRRLMLIRTLFVRKQQVENYAGDFPLWLAPVQLRLLPVTIDALEYCREVRNFETDRVELVCCLLEYSSVPLCAEGWEMWSVFFASPFCCLIRRDDQTQKELSGRGLRVEVDESGERLAKMIRNGEQEKIPLLAIVGAKEVENRTLSIRVRKGADEGAMTIEETTRRIEAAVQSAGDF